MLTVLLMIHVLCVIVWLGGAVYERFFILKGLHRTKGTQEEIVYAKLILATEKMFMVSTIGLLLTGIAMTIVAGYGFFAWNWLGLKQAIVVMMLVFSATYIAPRLKKFKAGIMPSLTDGKLIDSTTRSYLVKFYTGIDINHSLALINIVLAFWRPF